MRLAMAVLLLCAWAALEARAQTAGTGDLLLTSDAEGFDSLRLRTGALFDAESPFHSSGAALQWSRFSQGVWDRDAAGVVFLWRRQKPETLEGTLAEAGLIRVAGRTRLVGEGTWSVRPNARTGLEIVAAADLVETRRALESAIAYHLLGASLERQLRGRLTITGFAGYQRFTDENSRLHARGRLIWAAVPQQGVYLQVRWRGFESDRLDVNRAYFNPERYRQWDAGMYVRKRYAGWMLYGTVDAGRESIDSADQRATGRLELRGEGTLPGELRLIVHASFNRSAGFAIAEQYWYGRAGVMVVVPLR